MICSLIPKIALTLPLNAKESLENNSTYQGRSLIHLIDFKKSVALPRILKYRVCDIMVAMEAKITLTKGAYQRLERQAAAWRHAIGNSSRGAIFNAVRDNHGEGIEAGILAEKLRALIADNR